MFLQNGQLTYSNFANILERELPVLRYLAEYLWKVIALIAAFYLSTLYFALHLSMGMMRRLQNLSEFNAENSTVYLQYHALNVYAHTSTNHNLVIDSPPEIAFPLLISQNFCS
jgi:hypothetical protein